MRLHLITFYTEGEPYDKGENLTSEASKFIEKSKSHVDKVTAYCPRKLIKLNQKWEKIFTDQRGYMKKLTQNSNVKWNHSWAALNFLEWKPNLLDHILNISKKENSEDVFIYHDVNLKKYPDYLKNVKKWKNWIPNKIKNNHIILFNDDNLPFKTDCKKEVIDKYSLNELEDNHHIWCGIIIIKNTDISKKFIKQWCLLTADINNRSQYTNFSKKKGFESHSQEQACLTVLYYLWKIKKKRGVKCINLCNSRIVPPDFKQCAKFYIRKFLKIIF